MSDPGGSSPDPVGTDDSSKASELDQEGTVVADDGQIKTGEDPSNGTKKQLSRSAKWNKTETNVQPAVKDQTNPDKDKVDAARFQQQQLSTQMKQKDKNLDNVGSSTEEERKIIIKKGGLFVKPLVDNFEANKKKDEESSVGRGDSPQSEDYAETQGFEVIVDNGMDKLVFNNNLDHADGHIKNGSATYTKEGANDVHTDKNKHDESSLSPAPPGLGLGEIPKGNNTDDLVESVRNLAATPTAGNSTTPVPATQESINVKILETEHKPIPEPRQNVQSCVVKLETDTEFQPILPPDIPTNRSSVCRRVLPELPKNNHETNASFKTEDLCQEKNHPNVVSEIAAKEKTRSKECPKIKELLTTGACPDTENKPVGKRKDSNGELLSFEENGGKDEVKKKKTNQGDNGIRVTEENSSSKKQLTHAVSSDNSAESENSVARKADESLNVIPEPETEDKPVGNSNGELLSFEENGGKDGDENKKTNQGDNGIRVAEENSSSNKQLTHAVSSDNSAESENPVARKADESLNVKPISGEPETDLKGASGNPAESAQPNGDDGYEKDQILNAKPPLHETETNSTDNQMTNSKYSKGKLKSLEDTSKDEKETQRTIRSETKTIKETCRSKIGVQDTHEGDRESLSNTCNPPLDVNKMDCEDYSHMRGNNGGYTVETHDETLFLCFANKKLLYLQGFERFKDLTVTGKLIKADGNVFEIYEKELGEVGISHIPTAECPIPIVSELHESHKDSVKSVGSVSKDVNTNDTSDKKGNLSPDVKTNHRKFHGTSAVQVKEDNMKLEIVSMCRKTDGSLGLVENKEICMTLIQYMKYNFSMLNTRTSKEISGRFKENYMAELKFEETKILVVFENKESMRQCGISIQGMFEFVIQEMKFIEVESKEIKQVNVEDRKQILEMVSKSQLGQSNDVFVICDTEEQKIYFSYHETQKRIVKKFMEQCLTLLPMYVESVIFHILDTEKFKNIRKHSFPNVDLRCMDQADHLTSKISFRGDIAEIEKFKNWIETDLLEKFEFASSSFKNSVPENADLEKHIQMMSEFLEKFFECNREVEFFLCKEARRVWIYSDKNHAQVSVVNGKLKKCFEKGIIKDEITPIQDETVQFQAINFLLGKHNYVKIKLEDSRLCFIGPSKDVQQAKDDVNKYMKTNHDTEMQSKYMQETDQSSWNKAEAKSCEDSFGQLKPFRPHAEWIFTGGHCLQLGEIESNCFQGNPVIILTDQSSPYENVPGFASDEPFSIPVDATNWKKDKHHSSSLMADYLKEMKEMREIAIVVKNSFQQPPLKAVLHELFTWLKNDLSIPKTVFLACRSATTLGVLKDICLEALPDLECTTHEHEALQLTVEIPRVTIQKYQIAKMKADVIVNTTSVDFELHKGAVSKSILEVGGKDLQTAVNKKKKGKKYGDIIATEKCGDLNCKYVYHGALDNYTNETDLEKLKTFVFNCLKKASEMEFESIAFPAIGTGALGFHSWDVARMMFDAVRTFRHTASSQRTTLKTVFFIIFYKDNDCYQEFIKEEQRFLSTSNDEAYLNQSKCKEDVKQGRNSTGDVPIKQVKQHNEVTAPSEQEIDRGNSERNTRTRNGITLHHTPLMEKYVEVGNVQDNSTSESLYSQLNLKQLNLQLEPHLVYCSGKKTALLICANESDAGRIRKLISGPLVFRPPPPQYLVKPHTVMNGELYREFKRKGVFTKFKEDLEKAGIDLDCKDSCVLSAPTLYQIQFATQKMKFYKKENRENSESIVVETIANVSEALWAIICCQDDFKAIETEYTIYHSGTDILVEGIEAGDKLFTSFKQKVEHMKTLEIEEVAIAENDTQVQNWCSEINSKMEYKCCYYVKEKNKVFVLCNNYDDILKYRHFQNLLSGKIAKTRPRQRTGVITDDTIGNKLSPVSTSQVKKYGRTSSIQDFQEYFTKEGIKVVVYEADILNLEVDCIVNAANESLSHGGGVALAIARAAGSEMIKGDQSFLRKNKKLKVGTACSSPAGNLRYRRVIHTVGPDWKYYSPYDVVNVQRAEKDLFNAIYSSFLEAEKLGMASIALPAISSAIFAVPKDLCVYHYAKATIEYSQKANAGLTALKEIHFVDKNIVMVKAMQNVFQRWLREDKEPYYDSNVFVQQQSGRRGIGRQQRSFGNDSTFKSMQLQINMEDICLPEAMNFPEDDTNDLVYMFCGQEHKHQKILLSRNDISIIRSDAVVVTVNTKGVFGALGRKLCASLKEEYIKTQIKYLRSGDVVPIYGQGTSFRDILLAVFESSDWDKDAGSRKADIKRAYEEIFKQCISQDIASVAMTMIGIDTHKGHEVKMASEIFLECYIEHCKSYLRKKLSDKQLTVYLVCRDENTYELVQSVLSEYVQKTKPEEHHVNKQMNISHSDVASTQEICVICLELINEPKRLLCGHTFCTDCIDESFKVKEVCPICGKVLGTVTGNQPVGHMHVDKRRTDCCGYPGVGQIVITYTFPSGRQEECHPSPGAFYKGITRTAYLPDNKKGNEVLKMLKIAFDRKLVFTIGRSRTTGADDVITWNDIHHKTDHRPHSQFGYPDDGYLDRVIDELSAKGITVKDIAS